MVDVQRKEASNLYIFNLTFLFFVSGMVVFLAAMIAAMWLLPGMVRNETFRSPEGRFLAHLFLLGWATMIAMGASYQITQIVMRTSLYSRTLGYLHFICYSAGFIVLVSGLLLRAAWIVYGGVTLACGVLLYVWNLTMTFWRKKEWNLFVFGVSLSLLQFLITITLGILMGIGFAYGWNHRYEAIFGTHLWVGVGGWLSGLILVYSFKLLPMFLVSKQKQPQNAYWMIGIYHACIWLQTVPLWGGPAWIGWLATLGMAAALGWFTVYVFNVRRLSNGKHPAGTVNIAFCLIPVFYAIFLLWSVIRWFGSGAGAGVVPVGETLILLIILSWFTPTIFSYMARILPFLWWAKRFRTKEEKKNAVLLSDMLPERRMVWELVGYLAGIAAVACGFLIHSPSIAVWGQAFSVGMAVIYLFELTHVFRY